MEFDQGALSNGFFQGLVNGTASIGAQPTLQIIESRVMQNANLMRLRLSDGLFTYANCNASLEIADQLEADGYIGNHGIIKVTEFTRTVVGGKIMFTIINYVPMQVTNIIIGEPKPHSGNPEEYRGTPIGQKHNSGMQQQNYNPQMQQQNYNPQMQQQQYNPQMQQQQYNPQMQQQSPSRRRAMPGQGQGSAIPTKRPNSNAPTGGVFTDGLIQIQMVTPYANSFRICGAVSMKEEQRTINTKRGPSAVFSFVLTDVEGNSIKISAFGKECEKFSDLVQNGQAYYVTCVGGSVAREANKRFNSTGHTYELTLNSQCNIELCTDRDIGTPVVKLNAMRLIDIKHHANECVDVLAIVDKVEEVGSVTAKATQQQLKRRNVTLIDKSCTQVTITLWGEDGVEKITPDQVGQVIGIKGASVREFNGGFSLSMGSGSLIIISPDGQETAELYRWYAEERATSAVGSLTTDSGASYEQECRFIGVLKEVNLDGLDRGMFATVEAYVNSIKTDNIAYFACPSDNCKKKVIPEGNQWRCNSCGLFDTHKTLYILSVEIGDFSGLTWITLFDESATFLLGTTAEKLVELQTANRDIYDEVLAKNRYKTFEFRVRIANEFYNDQKRVRWSCMAARPVNIDRYKKTLENMIDRFH